MDTEEMTATEIAEKKASKKYYIYMRCGNCNYCTEFCVPYGVTADDYLKEIGEDKCPVCGCNDFTPAGLSRMP